MKHVAGPMIKVATADDHSLLRKALTKLVNSFDQCKMVLEADDGKSMLQQLRALTEKDRPDVVLLDVNMPVMDGYETAQILRKEFPTIKVVALSMFSNANTVVRMLKFGVRGYLTKNVEPDELLDAIKEVYKGNRYFSSIVIRAAMEYLSTADESSDKLTQKEEEVVKLIFQEKTSEEMAKKLAVSKRTVDTMIANIMEKLRVNSRVGIVLAMLRNNNVDLDGDPVA
jgi:DNA-binding NarL/FixJ family response regulator